MGPTLGGEYFKSVESDQYPFSNVSGPLVPRSRLPKYTSVQSDCRIDGYLHIQRYAENQMLCCAFSNLNRMRGCYNQRFSCLLDRSNFPIITRLPGSHINLSIDRFTPTSHQEPIEPIYQSTPHPSRPHVTNIIASN